MQVTLNKEEDNIQRNCSTAIVSLFCVLSVYTAPVHSLQVHRFLVQVSTDNISLTGLNFFPVTRTVLLTVSNLTFGDLTFPLPEYSGNINVVCRQKCKEFILL
jgi:hypothetical protein